MVCDSYELPSSTAPTKYHRLWHLRTIIDRGSYAIMLAAAPTKYRWHWLLRITITNTVNCSTCKTAARSSYRIHLTTASMQHLRSWLLWNIIDCRSYKMPLTAAPMHQPQFPTVSYCTSSNTLLECITYYHQPHQKSRIHNKSWIIKTITRTITTTVIIALDHYHHPRTNWIVDGD